jgi:hypothetical protein
VSAVCRVSRSSSGGRGSPGVAVRLKAGRPGNNWEAGGSAPLSRGALSMMHDEAAFSHYCHSHLCFFQAALALL